MWFTRQDRYESPEQDAVQEHVIAWHAAEQSRQGGRLTPAVRDRILEAALSGRRSMPLPSLFPPGRRLAFATALPILLGAALFLMVREPARQIAPMESLHAYKQADQVIFRIANGKRSHRVYRSTVAHHFDASSGTSVGGSFADDVDGSSPLVFYRIE